MIGKARMRFIILKGCMFCIAAVLFWSGAEHLKNPFAFLTSILRYKIVTGGPATLAATALPVLQTVLAGMMVLGVAKRLTSLCAAVLLSLFTLVQLSALVRGLEIGCGCFGAGNNAPITLYSVAPVAVLAAVAWLVFRLHVAAESAVATDGTQTDQGSSRIEIGGVRSLETCP